MNWTPEVTAKLLELAKFDIHAGFIADQINTAFDLKLTRCAVIGKLNRLKVVRPMVVEKRKPIQRQPHKPPVTSLVLRNDEVKREIVQRSTQQLCRWPVDGGACSNVATVCAYCDEHAKKAYREMPTVKRSIIFNKIDNEWNNR